MAEELLIILKFWKGLKAILVNKKSPDEHFAFCRFLNKKHLFSIKILNSKFLGGGLTISTKWTQKIFIRCQRWLYYKKYNYNIYGILINVHYINYGQIFLLLTCIKILCILKEMRQTKICILRKTQKYVMWQYYNV